MSRRLCFLPMGELAAKIRQEEISPVECVESFLERIRKVNSKLNAYIRVFETDSLKAAKEAARAISENKKVGPLHGVPLALKDVFDMKGVPTTHASAAFVNNVPSYNGTVVEKLINSGAILLGKLNLHEIAYGPTNDESYFGPCRNPWNTANITGGSSGGSGAAVAAFLCAGSLGTDAGGSVRIPAAFCGITGLKPTYGRVSRFGGGTCSWTLDHVGPMARTAKDIAILLKVISGMDTKDPTAVPIPVPDYLRRIEDGVEGIRIGIPREFFFDDIDPEVMKSVDRAVGKLADLGARVEDVRIPNVRYTRSVTLLIQMPEVAAFHEPFMSKQREKYGSFVRARLELGKLVYATEYLRAQRIRAVLIQEFQRVMKKIDVLVTPTVPIPAPKLGQKEVKIGGRTFKVWAIPARLTSTFNLLGLPALSVPCGFSSSGMPIGMQIIGRPFEEARILQVAQAYQSNTNWHARRPPI